MVDSQIMDIKISLRINLFYNMKQSKKYSPLRSDDKIKYNNDTYRKNNKSKREIKQK